MTNFGYCCINLDLRKKKVTCNRGMIKRTFESKGIAYAGELALQNVRDLIEIIKWNHRKGIKVYRMTSCLFPWMSEYELKDLPTYEKIKTLGKGIGQLVKNYGQRLSFHPGPFNVLGSPNPVLIKKTSKELNQHAEIMDLFCLEQTRKFPINIHCNGVYGDKAATLQRWSDNFKKLSYSAQQRLVVENDDKASMYSVKDLYDGIFSKVFVPITFDYHHHRFNSGGLSEQEAFELAMSTWLAQGARPLFHYSSCRRTFEDPKCKAQAHADYIYERINTYGHNIDIELEAKAKDVALLQYLKDETKLLEQYITIK